MKEIWKDIEGYPNYRISNFGKVYSKKRGIYLKNQLGNHGYYVVNLSNAGKQAAITIHKLVAEGFLPIASNYQCVNHKDGNKLNNNVLNLEKTTYKKNSQHAYDTGLQPNRKCIGWKRSESDIRFICELLTRKRVMDIARSTNFPESLIRSIKAKRIWIDITSEYDFLEVSDSGENRYNSVLTFAQAEEIRNIYQKYKTPSRKLGVMYNCNKTTILNIINNVSYKRDEN
jgi:hypothetical protein